MFKNEISIHRLCPQSVLKHSLVHSQGIGMFILKFENLKYFFQNIFGQKMFKNEISIHRLCPQSVLKHSLVHSQGIGMKI